jgi:tRNA pseudouridine55 synthase
MDPLHDRVLLINKPLHWTSFDVVNKLRHVLKAKKVGHAGTLDPLASGLLIICTGKMTKQIDEFQAQEKEYTGKFVLGQTTSSHDLETTPTQPIDIHALNDEQIQRATLAFVGIVNQTPPLHSAIKIGGKRAYELAREGKSAELKPRAVSIREFEITAIEKPVVGFRVVCSKGTYIRSLARDFGNALGVGAYLAELCRVRIGAFRLENAMRMEDVQ